MDKTHQITIDLPRQTIDILKDVERRLGVPVPMQAKIIILHYIENNKAVIKYDGGRSLLFDHMSGPDQFD